MGAFTIMFIMALSFIAFGFFASYLAFRNQLNEKKLWNSFKIFTVIFIMSVIQNRTLQESINLRKQKQEKTVSFSEKKKINKDEFDFKYKDNSFNFNTGIGEKNDKSN